MARMFPTREVKLTLLFAALAFVSNDSVQFMYPLLVVGISVVPIVCKAVDAAAVAVEDVMPKSAERMS